MNLFTLICVGYIILCLLCSIFIPSIRFSWKSMYNDVIIESYRDKKEDDIIFMKVIITFIQVLIITLLFSLCFLLFPFCIYWLNRRYQIEKKSKIENDKKEKEMIEWHKMDDWFEPSNKEEYKYPPVFIEINTDLPFHPDEKQIIYLETQYNVPLNSYISKEYETIKEFFKQCGYTFIYIPKFINEIAKDGDRMIKYAYPQLSDTDILKDIYMQITNRLDFWKTQKSIDDIIDPTKNAINEKCSRIREAFIGKFDESLAQNYFITGVRLEPKRITLDRQLVVWETER